MFCEPSFAPLFDPCLYPLSAAGLSSLTSGLRHWLSAPPSAYQLAPDLPPDPGPVDILLSSAPLSAQLSQRAERRWRRLAELAAGKPSRQMLGKLAALAHKLANGTGGAGGRG